MENNTENAQPATEESAKERFTRILNEYAQKITSVRNDVYTTKWWQFVINFLLGGGAIALLVVSMLTKGTAMAMCAISGIALVIGVIVFNYVLRSITPTSFLQYTYFDGGRDKRFRFMVLSKKRAAFDDGTHTIECNRDMAAMMDDPLLTQYRFDFFADMDPTERIYDGRREEFRGVLTEGDKQYKCKIVFVNGVPLYGSIGGARIKYFDVNNTKEKFVVPVTLKRAAKALKVEFPKIPGLYVKDDIKDYTKQ
ncbi:MAG: hypothetical protein K2M47_04325 [Clostridiales bacterium]|nr:hypothetical protein [Clostridiales bacterium]MDE6201085.1 hypothetical protein [Clostridiales bacterium]